LIGSLHIANPKNGCGPLEPFKSKQEDDISPIVIIERGNCTFVTKTHYAQLIGAKMALIIDNINENEDRVIMIDDGEGNDINIPTVMIDKLDGDRLVDILNTNIKDSEQKNYVSMTFKFEMPHPDNRVEYEYWMSSLDNKSYEFVKAIKNMN